MQGLVKCEHSELSNFDGGNNSHLGHTQAIPLTLGLTPNLA